MCVLGRFLDGFHFFALDRGANLAWLGNYRRLDRGLRDQSTHERGLDQNRYDTPYGAKARLSFVF
jgi:hypothetical protein